MAIDCLGDLHIRNILFAENRRYCSALDHNVMILLEHAYEAFNKPST